MRISTMKVMCAVECRCVTSYDYYCDTDHNEDDAADDDDGDDDNE